MAGTTLPNLGLKYDWNLGATYKTDMDANLQRLDTVVQAPVLDRDQTTPPGSPTAGDVYIPAATATGAWVSQEGVLALWTGTTWVFYPPKIGWSVWLVDEKRRVVWDGTSWLFEGPTGVVSASSAAGVLDLDFSLGNNFQVTLTESVTSVTVSNFSAKVNREPVTVEFTQDATGGWTVGGWPTAVKWPGGAAPVITSTAGAVDVLEGFSLDAGTTIRLARTQANSS